MHDFRGVKSGCKNEKGEIKSKKDCEFFDSLTIMSAWVQKVGLFPNGLNQNLFFSLGFGIGNFIWLYLLSMIVLKNRHKLSDGSIARIKQFAGATFIGFGGFIGYRVIMFTNWANIFKYAVVF